MLRLIDHDLRLKRWFIRMMTDVLTDAYMGDLLDRRTGGGINGWMDGWIGVQMER